MSQQESLFTTGFNDWGKGHEKIDAHRKSPQHRNAVSATIIRSKINCGIDKSLIVEFETETKYWRNVPFCVLDVLKFLCELGLAIRGKDESIGSVHNGNYLGIICKYDPFLRKHTDTYGNRGKGTTSYLSHSICEELIKIMADKVLKQIIEEV